MNNSLFEHEITDGRISFVLPLKTVSEANISEHWTKKHKRHQQQKRIIQLAILPHRDKIQIPCTITFTRYSPRFLDKHDNLPYSFKAACDIVCNILTPGLKPGRADDNEEISIKYAQIKSKTYFIKIEFDWTN